MNERFMGNKDTIQARNCQSFKLSRKGKIGQTAAVAY